MLPDFQYFCQPIIDRTYQMGLQLLTFGVHYLTLGGWEE